MAHGPSCSAACGIFPDQGSNPCPLHWQADSQPLRHQGSPYNTNGLSNLGERTWEGPGATVSSERSKVHQYIKHWEDLEERNMFESHVPWLFITELHFLPIISINKLHGAFYERLDWTF